MLDSVTLENVVTIHELIEENNRIICQQIQKMLKIDTFNSSHSLKNEKDSDTISTHTYFQTKWEESKLA